MRVYKILMFLATLLAVAAVLLFYAPESAFSTPPLGVKPTPEPPIVPPGIAFSPEPELPKTGEGAIMPFPAALSDLIESLKARLFSFQPASSKSESISVTQIAKVTDRTAIERLVIPALRIDTAVKAIAFNGTSWDVEDLGQKIGWLEGTSLPGLGGNAVVAGHLTLKNTANGPFRYLLYLQPGDDILVYTHNNAYRYEVLDQATLAPDANWVTKPTSEPRLTLVTCSQWDQATNTFKYRRVVFAKLVNISEIQAVIEGQ